MLGDLYRRAGNSVCIRETPGKFERVDIDGFFSLKQQGIAMFLVTSPIVIIVPTRGLLAVETMHAIVQWLANLNIKRNMTSMFVNKKHRYSK